MLSAPMDTQQKTMDDDEEYVTSSAILGANPIQPNPDSLERAADIIASSSKPLVIVGRGAMRSGAGDAVIRLAERTGALIATTLMAKNWLSEEPYYVGHLRLLRHPHGHGAVPGSGLRDRRRRQPEPLHHRARLPVSQRALYPHRQQAARADGRRQGRGLLRARRCAAGRRRTGRACSPLDRFSNTGYRTAEVQAATGQSSRRHCRVSDRSRPRRSARGVSGAG